MDLGDTNIYKEQLKQIDVALKSCPEGPEKDELLALKTSIKELLALTNEGDTNVPSASNSDPLADEFALFMSEMEKEGAVDSKEKCKNLEGMKCRAPHKHQWGDTAYHNAMVCSVLPENTTNENEIQVRVLYTNPTHPEMLPCPYYFDSDCKFSEDKCRFSHGEIVQFSALKQYVEPQFHHLGVGSRVLAKKDNNLWYRGVVRRLYDEKCLVKFESNQKDLEVVLEHIFPLENDLEQNECKNSDDSDSDNKLEGEDEEDVINMSLMITPSNQALGDWEKYTKGIGSKLMEKMGYIVGTGLGRRSDGRIDPVTAIILPAGKSLDHCMQLRENAGGDKDLFSVEKKLKRLQKKQELQNQKAYEREQNKVDVFNFINKTLSGGGQSDADGKLTKSKHRQEIKKESSRNLNVASLQIDENIRRAERDLDKIKESLTRHTDCKSQMHKSLSEKLSFKQVELKSLQTQALNIKNEQSVRSDKRKLTIF